ncbi:hypothetical protein V1478_008681, partial [Vespula squamosa]
IRAKHEERKAGLIKQLKQRRSPSPKSLYRKEGMELGGRVETTKMSIPRDRDREEDDEKENATTRQPPHAFSIVDEKRISVTRESKMQMETTKIQLSPKEASVKDVLPKRCTTQEDTMEKLRRYYVREVTAARREAVVLNKDNERTDQCMRRK